MSQTPTKTTPSQQKIEQAKKQAKAASTRAKYNDEQKAGVAILYQLCRSPKDRERVAERFDIGSLQKIYNLASRIAATRPHANSQQDLTSDLGYDPTNDTSLLFLRDDPETLKWSKDDDRYLREHFGRTHIEGIGVFLQRSETAVAHRARQLGLRNVPKYYDIRKIAPWLGLELREVLMLTRYGLEVFPCTDARGKMRITLVSTTSLARVLLQKRIWKLLVDKHDADLFFIRDVIESIAELQKGEAIWEPNSWVSHGHTCLNPFTDTSFGLFYDGYDKELDGIDNLDPRDLNPAANVASDHWRRGTHGHDRSEQELRELIPHLERHIYADAEETVAA